MEARRKIIPIFVPHLGCPNQCVFCNQRRISGSLFPASAQTVRDALSPLEGQQGYELAFYGGSFTATDREIQRELLSAAQPYRQSGLVVRIRVSTRPDAVDASVLDFLKSYGVETVELGAQSMTEEALRRSGRGHTAEDTVRAAALVRRAGMKLVLQMMTGLPGETEQSALESGRRIVGLSPDAVRIYPTVILRDTSLYELWQAGEYREHTVDEAAEICAKLLAFFYEANIPVIRLGLNPTDDLSGGDAVGGAYHPALGELARSRLYLRRAEALLSPYTGAEKVTLGVSGAALSQMIGQKRRNIELLQEKFALGQLRVLPSDVPWGEILLIDVAMREEKV